MKLLHPCLALLLAACGNTTPSPADAAIPTTTTTAAPPPVVPSVAPSATPAPVEPESDAGAPPVVADNKVEPTQGPELLERARALLLAIAEDDPARAEAFWFPKEPFIPLKDVKDPGKYWRELHRMYANDIHALHKKRKSWDGVELVSFDGWSRPKWVKPGDEVNKIGYYRAFHGKLRYELGEAEGVIDVHTIITWQGRWYCTHLRKIKK